MKKKTKNKKKHIIIGIVIAIFIVIITSFLFRNENNNVNGEYNSLRELFARFDCRYIKEENSKFQDVITDIYIKFGKDLYTKENSNERYFIDIIQTVAKFEQYENFALIDEERKIEIIAIANEEKTMLTRIFINGDSNYFGNYESKEALKKQEEERITPMNITSNELKRLIQNEWTRKDVNFGTRETIYENYYCYFDEGIDVRTISAKVYNIIFRKNYKNEILRGITTNMSNEVIIDILGEPTFGSKEDRVIGYKGENIYIFFSDEGVSVYPNETYKTEEFINIVKNIPNGMNINELLDKITNKWNDYDKYVYNLENYICIRYSLKGVQIQFNMENNNGIVFYNNYKGNFGDGLARKDMQNDTSKIPDRFYFENQDLVYIAELERYDEEELIYLPEGYSEVANQETQKFYYTIEKYNGTQKNLKVISKTKEYANANVELDVEILSCMWIDEENLVYSVKKRRNLFI